MTIYEELAHNDIFLGSSSSLMQTCYAAGVSVAARFFVMWSSAALLSTNLLSNV